jgi:hypothetical protein
MIITKDELMKDKSKVKLKVLLNGAFGSGKTFGAMTFPRWAYAQIEPNGLMTAKSNPHLMENMVEADQFILSKDEDVGETFKRLSAYCSKAREMAKKGEIETFILDNLSHLSVNRWAHIEKYEKAVSAKTGKEDTQAMYGTLSKWLYKFILTEVVSLPCHVVVCCHTQDEETDDGTGKLVATGRVISQTLGGFRNQASSLFNASLFLECKSQKGVHTYSAQCLPSHQFAAKNNVGLPQIVENISYKTIMENLHRDVTTK